VWSLAEGPLGGLVFYGRGIGGQELRSFRATITGMLTAVPMWGEAGLNRKIVGWCSILFSFPVLPSFGLQCIEPCWSLVSF
jgi:hypothetical protein